MNQDSRSTRSINEPGFKAHKVSKWAKIQGQRGQWMSQDSSVNDPGFKVHKVSEWAWIQCPQGQWMSQDSSPVPYLWSYPASSIIWTRVCKILYKAEHDWQLLLKTVCVTKDQNTHNVKNNAFFFNGTTEQCGIFGSRPLGVQSIIRLRIKALSCIRCYAEGYCDEEVIAWISQSRNTNSCRLYSKVL